MSNKILSPAEQFCVQLENQEPNYYSRIPHILSDLAYDKINPKTGQVVKKRLSVFAKELYRVLKSTAGDYGKCWKNTKHLAEECNMSPGMVSKAKAELTQKFDLLDGKSLITITKKKKSLLNDQRLVSQSTYDEITIIGIWNYNNANMSVRAFMNKNKEVEVEADSPHESVGGADSPHESVPEGADSLHERNKNPNNKNSLYNKQQPTAVADPVVFLKNKDFCSLSSEQKDFRKWVIEAGGTEKTANVLIFKYPILDLKQAFEYTRAQFKKNKAKGKTMGNIIGYLQTVLQNKYWERK
jgi:hypothetical protein